jgi:site-specific DNA recombinase
MKKTVGYARVSTAEQAKGYSLDNQVSAISDYCGFNDLNLERMFREEGRSGKETTKRDQFLAMIDYCLDKSNKIECVVVYHPNRFARNVMDHLMMQDLLEKNGIELQFVMVKNDGSSSGKMNVNLFAVLAQYENDQKSEVVVAAIKRGLEMGRWMGKAPLGYLRNRVSKTPSLVIDEEKAEFIRYIFDQVDLGVRTKADILRDVTRMGLMTLKGKPLTNQAIDKMLCNPIYCGMVYSKKNDFLGIGDFEPIVSKDQFDRINAKPGKLAGIKHTGRDAEFPLRRFVICGKCLVTLTGSEPSGRRKRYKYYSCKNKKCSMGSIPLIDLELLYLDELEKLSAKPEALDLLEAVMRDVWKTKRFDAERKQKANAQRLQVLEEKKESLNELFIYKKHIPVETYNDELKKIDDETKLLESEITHEAIQEEKLIEVIAKAKSYFTNLPYCWNRLQSPVRKQFQTLIHPDGLILKDGKLGTPRKSWLFIDFADLKAQSNTCVPPTGFEPVLPP